MVLIGDKSNNKALDYGLFHVYHVEEKGFHHLFIRPAKHQQKGLKVLNPQPATFKHIDLKSASKRANML